MCGIRGSARRRLLVVSLFVSILACALAALRGAERVETSIRVLIRHLPAGRPDCGGLIPTCVDRRQLPPTVADRSARLRPTVLNWVQLSPNDPDEFTTSWVELSRGEVVGWSGGTLNPRNEGSNAMRCVDLCEYYARLRNQTINFLFYFILYFFLLADGNKIQYNA